MRLVVLSMLLLIPLAACDPCAGVVACRGGPQFSLEGQLWEYWADRAPARSLVTFVRTGGIALEQDSITADTDGNGYFVLRSTALQKGTVEGSIVVQPPDRPSYRVDGLRFSTADVRGEGAILPERWVVDPYIYFVGELRDRNNQRILRSMLIDFVPKSGPKPSESKYSTFTDPFGRFTLRFPVDSPGTVVGDLIVRPSSHPFAADRVNLGTEVREGMRLNTIYRMDAHEFAVILNGPSLTYAAELVYRGTSDRVPNAQVEFRRTGGVALEANVYRSRTDNFGRFPLLLVPRDTGEVIGDLTVTAERFGGPVTVRGIRLPTHRSDVAPLKLFFVGPHLPYAGLIQYQDTGAPAVGVEIEVRRLSGIQMVQNQFVTQSNQWGTFPVSSPPRSEGTVTVEVSIRPQTPYLPITDTLRLETTHDDVMGVLKRQWLLRRR